MRIGINCGHTVSGEVGCGVVDYIDESVEARKVGYALETLLKNAGHTVYDCTNDHADSVGKNLSNIVNMANAQQLDFRVAAMYHHTVTDKYSDVGYRLARVICACKKYNVAGFCVRS